MARLRVTTLDVRRELGDLLNRVALRHDQFVIERRGKPLAALVPVEKLEQMERFARQHLREFLRRPRSHHLTQEQADRLANEAKHESRPKRRKRRR